jgi:hypothetical protein
MGTRSSDLARQQRPGSRRFRHLRGQLLPGRHAGGGARWHQVTLPHRGGGRTGRTTPGKRQPASGGAGAGAGRAHGLAHASVFERPRCGLGRSLDKAQAVVEQLARRPGGGPAPTESHPGQADTWRQPPPPARPLSATPGSSPAPPGPDRRSPPTWPRPSWRCCPRPAFVDTREGILRRRSAAALRAA